MSNYSDIFTGLKTILEANVTGLKSHEHPPDHVNHFPSAIPIPDAFEPEMAFGGNTFDARIRIIVLVSSAESSVGWAALMDMIDPTTANKSIIKAIRDNRTLDSKVDSSRIVSVENIGRRELWGGFYFGFDVVIEAIKAVA